ncbi:sensor histidine kinase [Halostreptopolyspora alba]|uniref:sensor histidine kinase n=1 Tax=Halostreptopolyspora alba TaxID=2487137 RepID=UPI00371D66FF
MPLLQRHPRVVDVAVAAAHLLPTAAGSAHLLVTGEVESWRAWVGLALTAVVTALLLMRRARPLTVLGAVTGLGLVQGLSTGQLITPALPVLLYTVGTRMGPGPALGALGAVAGISAAGLTVVDVTLGLGTIGGLRSALVITVTVLPLATLLGALVGLRRRYVLALVERAEQAEREQEQRARLARADERNRVSREIHDIVGHTLTAIVNLSDGVDTSLTHTPDQARQGVRTINTIAREALDDTRAVLGSLRSDDATRPRTPEGDRGWLSHPLDTARAAGLSVECTEVGESSSAGGSVLASAQRILQEAVTNTLRHAEAATGIDVRITHTQGGMEIHVRDDGRSPRPDVGDPGHGLLGIQERAAHHHGRAVAGPATGGGWYVHVELHSAESAEAEP